MNRQKSVKYVGIAILIVGSLCYAFGAIMAHGWGNGNRNIRGWNQQRNTANGWFLGEERRKARIAVLAELSGQSEKTINEKLEYKPTWAVLDEYQVDFKTYQGKMQERTRKIISQAAADGKIDEAQKNFMLERMNNAPDIGLCDQRGWRKGKGKGTKRGFTHGPWWN